MLIAGCPKDETIEIKKSFSSIKEKERQKKRKKEMKMKIPDVIKTEKEVKEM